MKVKCTQCGKRFDYDTYMGMCPNCSTYHKKDSNDSSLTKSANPDYSPSKQQNTPKIRQQETEKQKKTKHSRLYHITTIVLCAIIILSIVFTLLLVKHINELGHEAGSLTELPEPIPLSIGVSTTVPYVENNFSFTITGATLIQDNNYQLPDGYELVQVSYRAGTPETYDTYSESEYSYYSDSSIRRGLLPYLITKSGSYLAPLRGYNFEDIHILESEAVDELELSSYFEYAVGSFYFLVKENDAKGLRINCHKEQSDSWGNSVKPLEACYEITDLEVY